MPVLLLSEHSPARLERSPPAVVWRSGVNTGAHRCSSTSTGWLNWIG